MLAFYRRYEGKTILVIANLSRFVQPVDLNLSEFQGFTPVEMFGGTEFPVLSRRIIIFFTIGPNAFYWFSLEQRQKLLESSGDASPRTLELPVQSWDQVWGEEADAPILGPLTCRNI